MIVNGWQLYYFHLFDLTLKKLEKEVTMLAKKDPEGYKSHPKTRLLACIYKGITHTIPANPDHAHFRLGKTLGNTQTNWRRLKKGLPDRFRLFFRFSSTPIKLIIYVWFNDENNLRKEGSKTDVYETFKRMLTRGEVPTNIDQLLEKASEPA